MFQKYIDFLINVVINDINYFEIIYQKYNYGSWLIIGFFYLIWYIIKLILILLPVTYLLTNVKESLSNNKYVNKIRKKVGI